MRVAPFLTLALLLPGCFTQGGGEPAVAPGPRVLPWGITECRYFVMDVPLPPERLQPFMPEGFAPQAGEGPLALVRGGSYLGLEAVACESGAGLDGDVSPLDYGSFFTSVLPPENLTVEGVDSLFMKWDVLVPDAPRREALQAEGLPARAGAVTIAERIPGGAQVSARLEMEGVGLVSMAGFITGTGEAFGGSFVEYMPAEDGGIALWRADYESGPPQRGTATVVLPEGSLPAQMVGRTRADGTFITGTWTFTNATITPPS